MCKKSLAVETVNRSIELGREEVRIRIRGGAEEVEIEEDLALRAAGEAGRKFED